MHTCAAFDGFAAEPAVFFRYTQHILKPSLTPEDYDAVLVPNPAGNAPAAPTACTSANTVTAQGADNLPTYSVGSYWTMTHLMSMPDDIRFLFFDSAQLAYHGQIIPGTFTPGSALQFQRMAYEGPLRSVLSGTGASYAGPAYWDGAAGYVLLDTARDELVLGPPFGAAGTAIEWTGGGTVRVKGAFARASTARGAGDGVYVAIYRSLSPAVPIWSGSIGADQTVDPTDPFGGTGVAAFDVTVSLGATSDPFSSNNNEGLIFAVFAGPPGSSSTLFADETALRFSISRQVRVYKAGN